MPVDRFERGAIVRCNNATWIVWSYPKRDRHADPIALPVQPQTAPRHRAQAPLDLAGRAVVVNLLDPVSLPKRDCELIGRCNERTVNLLAQSMQRAIDAAESERLNG